MNVWLLKTGEPMPMVNEGQRLMRMGMIAKELNSRGHKVTWFSSTFDHFHKKQLYDKDSVVQVQEDYEIHLLHGMAYQKNIAVKRIINHKQIAQKFEKIAKDLEKPDLIYVSFPTIDFAQKAVIYGKKNNIPVIVDIRDLWPDIFQYNLTGIKKVIASPYIAWMNVKTKKIMRDAFAINSISEAMLEWGLQKGNRTKKADDRFFYIGFDQKENEVLEDSTLIDKNQFNISFAGTTNNQFDYDKIIELAKYLEKEEDIVINICGDGPQFEELKEKTKDLKQVKLFGWLESNKINAILKNSKLGFAPYKDTFNFQKGVTNKLAEYASYGLPILLTSSGYMQKIVEETDCGMATQDMKKMSEWILLLKNHAEKYEKVSKNAYQLYQSRFIAKEIYPKLVDYLEEIVKQGRK